MKMLAFLAYVFVHILGATVRVRHVRHANHASLGQFILAIWHSHLVLATRSRFPRPISVMISRSKDGELIARYFDWYGIDAVRGSSSRGGGEALRELIREARNGKTIVFTPDGPRGPARVVKEGVIAAARATGLPIAPIVFACKKKSCCARGTVPSCRSRSRARSSSTASRSRSRATPTLKSGGRSWSRG